MTGGKANCHDDLTENGRMTQHSWVYNSYALLLSFFSSSSPQRIGLAQVEHLVLGVFVLLHVPRGGRVRPSAASNLKELPGGHGPRASPDRRLLDRASLMCWLD